MKFLNLLLQMIILFLVSGVILSVSIRSCSSASIQQQTKNQKQQPSIKSQSGGRIGLTPLPQQEQPLQSEIPNINDVQPIPLQYCFRAIQFVQKTGQFVQEVVDITGDETLPPLIAEVSGAAQKAFIFSEIAIGLTGEPVYEAVNATRSATIVARNASTMALKVASNYSATQPGAENSHKAVQAAQRSTLAAQSAQHQVLQAGAGPF